VPNQNPLKRLSLQDLEIVYLHVEALRRPDFLKAVESEITERVRGAIVEWKLYCRQQKLMQSDAPTQDPATPPPPADDE